MTKIDPPNHSLADPVRLAALDALAVLDTPTEQGFDDVVRLASRLCAAPVALVSLVAADRQWFKARIGFPHCETDLDRSVCKFALGEPDLLIIPDLAADPLTAANPLVTGEPYIRFYAGAPLRLADGQVVGSLCVIDTVPRPGGLTPEQADDLRALGRQVSVLLEMRRAVERRDRVLDDQRAEVRQARRLDFLAQASAALLGASDAAGVLEPILTTSAPALGFDQSFIYDVDPDERHLRLVRSIGTDEATRSALACVALDVPLCGLVVQSRRPLVLNALQASTEPRYAIARDAGVTAYAGYPITSRGRLAGIVSFTSTREPAFDAEALAFFAALARLMSSVRERLDTDAALRASDTRSRLAQEAGQIGTFEVDVASGLVSISAEFAKLYGVPATGLYSAERFEALVVPEDRALPSNESTRQDGSAALDVEYRIRRVDDDALRWIARRASFVRDAAGTVVQMFGTVQDVTDRHAAQDALRESEERYRTLFEAIDDGFCIIEFLDGPHGPLSDYLHVDANPGYERHTGIAGIVGQTIRGLAPDEADGWVELYGEVLRTGRPIRFERDFVAAGRHIEVAAARVEPESRRQVSLLFRDVTARKKAEAELRVSEAEARENGERIQLALAAGAIIGTWHWDLPSDRFTVDEAFARSFGLDPSLGREGIPLAQIVATVHPDDQAGLAAAITASILRGGAYAHQYRVRHADGDYRWIEANGRVDHAPDGTPLSFPGVLLDVQERRAADMRRDALLALGDRLRDLDTAPAIISVSSEIMAGVLGAARAGYGSINTNQMTMDIPGDWCAPGVASVAGFHDLRVFGAYAEDMKRGELVVVDDLEAAPRDPAAAAVLMSFGIRMMISVPIMERGRLVGAGFVHYAELQTISADDLAFVRTVVDRMQIALARVKAEEQQALLNGELSHRLKNTLSMVQGIAAQTLRGVPDQAPVEAFTKRLIALSQAHDVLLQDSWAAASIRTVVERVLLLQAPLERFRIKGADLALLPQATLSLSLLLHELTTNAVKYGALSTEAGMVSVAWRIEDDSERTVALTWQERGGPPAQAPTRRGFGTRLIQLGLVGTRDTRLNYTRLGLDAEFRAPVSEMVAS